MSYIVVYQREDGSSGVEECADLDLAVVTAERLRNVDAVERPRIFQTSEITYDFKPYYRVEVTSDASASAEMPPPAPATPVVESSAAATAKTEKAESEPAKSASANDSTKSDEAEVAADKAASNEKPGRPDTPTVPSETPTVTSRSGLFGDANKKDASLSELPEVEELDEKADAVPSRRGLFGR